MKLTHEPLVLSTRRTFRIAGESADAYEHVLVRLEHEGVVGLGEAAPSPRVTHEDAHSVRQLLDWAAKEIRDLDPVEWRVFLAHLHEDICGNPSARAGLDLALHDLVGKLRGIPARELHGVAPGRLETTMTVSLDTPEAMAAEARTYAAQGFRLIKLKLGDAPRDAARVRAVREAVPQAKLRADANCAWSAEESRLLLPELAQMGVTCVEQPVPAQQLRVLADLSRESPIPLYADESVMDLHDVERLHRAGFVGGVNLKIAKAGGLLPVLDAARAAHARGYRVQLGCMVESGIGISAGLQLLAELDQIDLDGDLLLATDPYPAPAAQGGWRASPAGPGLGFRTR